MCCGYIMSKNDQRKWKMEWHMVDAVLLAVRARFSNTQKACIACSSTACRTLSLYLRRIHSSSWGKRTRLKILIRGNSWVGHLQRTVSFLDAKSTEHSANFYTELCEVLFLAIPLFDGWRQTRRIIAVTYDSVSRGSDIFPRVLNVSHVDNWLHPILSGSPCRCVAHVCVSLPAQSLTNNAPHTRASTQWICIYMYVCTDSIIQRHISTRDVVHVPCTTSRMQHEHHSFRIDGGHTKKGTKK